jgi:hypothetical protein
MLHNGISSWSVHKDIYEKANGENSAQVFIGAWPWLKNIHTSYPSDVLQLNTIKFPLLEKHRKASDPFWTSTNPHPINSIQDDRGIIEFVENNKEIMIQSIEEVTELLALKNVNPKEVILTLVTYEGGCALFVVRLVSVRQKSELKLSLK